MLQSNIEGYCLTEFHYFISQDKAASKRDTLLYLPVGSQDTNLG